MAKIRKEEIQNHIVIPDTNILWYKEKAIIVNPEFDKFWELQSNLAPLNLFIPSVVKGELLFLLNKSANKSFEMVKENILKLSQITSYNYRNPIKESSIKSNIEKKFDNWLSGKNGSVLEIPVTQIDWLKLCDNSIWRINPFVEDTDKENEKGFRDTIILETVLKYYNNKKKDDVIVFLCNDGILKNCAENKLGNKADFLTYESLNAFSSYLKLRHEKLTKEFVKAISQKAKDKFLNVKDKGSLFFKENILERIQKDFDSDLNNPEEKKDFHNVLSKLLSSPVEKWQPIAEGKWWVVSPTFDKIENENNYYWISEIIFIRNYQKESSGLLSENKSLLDLIPVKRSSIIRFNVFWESIVRKDGRFYDCKVNNIELGQKEFKLPTQEEIEKFKISM